MRKMPECSVDAVVTDPPAGISFMNLKFDSDRGGRKQWVAWLTEIMVEALRVTRPGGHAFVWALPRTSHWTAWALEDAGWEIREICHHIFGSGFPKSLDVSKQIDKMNGRNFEQQLELARHIKDRRIAAGVSRATVNSWLDAALKCEHYESESVDFNRVPTLSDWRILSERLHLSNEFLPLVERIEAEREVVEERVMVQGGGNAFELRMGERRKVEANITTPATESAKQWEGWGSSLKPSVENWILCRKPLSESSIARNILEHSTGAINIGATRVEGKRWPANLLLSHAPECERVGVKRVRGSHIPGPNGGKGLLGKNGIYSNAGGAEDISYHYADPDGYEEIESFECAPGCPILELDRQSGTTRNGGQNYTSDSKNTSMFGIGASHGVGATKFSGDSGGASRYFLNLPPENTTQFHEPDTGPEFLDIKEDKEYASKTTYVKGMDSLDADTSRLQTGQEPSGSREPVPQEGASRPLDVGPGFLYQAKASRAERNRGLEGMPEKAIDRYNECGQGGTPQQTPRQTRVETNNHPTVKPLALMRWLVRLVTPPGGVVLDCFAGSGTTLLAAIQENVDAIGIEAEEEYCTIAAGRIAACNSQKEPPKPKPLKVVSKSSESNVEAQMSLFEEGA